MNIALWSVIIFFSIMTQVLLGTIRLIVMVKNKKILAVVIGFFESATALVIAIKVISQAVTEGINIYIILSYAAGFALGLFVGMLLSQVISKDILSVNIISRKHNQEIEAFLREKGFGVTCYTGSGMDGEIRVLNIICRKKNFDELKSLVSKIDRKVLVTSHALEGLSGGFLYDIKSRI